MKPIIIIGAGLAGYSVARELRKLDKTVPLMIVTADDGGFYSKPMLSNAFAQGKQAQQLVSQSATQMADRLNAVVMTDTRINAIDTAAKQIVTDGGAFDYEKLVIAVGAQPIRLAIDGAAAEQILSINHLSDYALFRTHIARIEAARKSAAVRIAILGAGLIGCEFANDLAHAGHAVTLVDPNPLPLAALAAPALSQGLHAALLTSGVALRLGTTAARIEHKRDALQLTLSDATTLDADIVLSAVGLRPDLRLAQAAQLTVGRGIHVDAAGRTSAPDVYALGDCAEYTMPDGGGMRILPYIAPLMNAARAIASALNDAPGMIDLKPVPVIVKTPCYPLALVPPPTLHHTGSWHTSIENGCTVCRFFDAQGIMTGFGVSPQEAGIRQTLLAALGSPAAVPAIDTAA